MKYWLCKDDAITYCVIIDSKLIVFTFFSDCGHFIIIPISGMEPLTKRRKYEASFKLKVVDVAKGSNNCAAARQFDVTEKMVREWRKKENDIRQMPKNKCAMRRGITRWSKLEDDVAEWVLQQRQDGYIVTRNKIRSHALKWAKANKEESNDFKATVGWYSRFMNRRNLVIRERTKIAQKLPKDLEHNMTNFHKFIIQLRKRHKFPLSHIRKYG